MCIMSITLEQLRRALGVDINGGALSCPAPGHSKDDRGLRVFVDPNNADGFTVTSFNGHGWQECRDFIKEKLGIAPWRPGERADDDRFSPTSGAVLRRRSGAGRHRRAH